jgi:hypothetical protein
MCKIERWSGTGTTLSATAFRNSRGSCYRNAITEAPAIQHA